MSIFESFEKKSIPKGTILLSEGEFCRFGCKVVSGCLKSYIFDRMGKEHIIQFAPEGWIITDMESLYHQKPSKIFIEAIEDTVAHWIQGDMVETWEKSRREDLITQIQMLTRNIITSNKRTRMLLSSTGKERYNDFLNTYPTLAQRLPLKLIASYIGVTPEYLSEIRRKIAGK